MKLSSLLLTSLSYKIIITSLKEVFFLQLPPCSSYSWVLGETHPLPCLVSKQDLIEYQTQEYQTQEYPCKSTSKHGLHITVFPTCIRELIISTIHEECLGSILMRSRRRHNRDANCYVLLRVKDLFII